ncbi:hypothetical protein MNBD_UNCLBAC01-2171 [hydrothermal vent metagenome]|uniref:Antitoxin n=2 Tax=hydrothermal vent metagenome TaxID=652676 RepID=A0A3B1DJ36_9ZZZZ
MIEVNVKELLHHFAEYKEKVKAGERVVVLERKIPIIDLTPYKKHVEKPVWKRNHYILPATKVSASNLCIKMRQEERA